MTFNKINSFSSNNQLILQHRMYKVFIILYLSQAAACDGNVYTIDHTRPIALPGTLPYKTKTFKHLALF